MTSQPSPGTPNLGLAFDLRFEDLYNDGDDRGLAHVDAATIMIMNAINSASEPMAPFTNSVIARTGRRLSAHHLPGYYDRRH